MPETDATRRLVSVTFLLFVGLIASALAAEAGGWMAGLLVLLVLVGIAVAVGANSVVLAVGAPIIALFSRRRGPRKP